MEKQTKIIATISDLRCDVEFIRALFNEGMNVARLNSAHMDIEGFDRVIGNIRTVSNQIGILIDTKGPEVRTTKSESPIEIRTSDRIKIKGDPNMVSSKEMIAVSYKDFVNDVNVGADILFDDGEIDVKVLAKEEDYLLCEALNDGVLGSRKSVNVPGVRINLPSLTERDKRNILYAIDKKIDFIAHSFVRNREDVLEIQKILDEHNSDIKIIAKIENQEGVDNADEILEYAYGLMIARGDLGIEVAQEKIPGIQRVLIRKSVIAKKPVIVATQMLHTMINNPRPTRAEVTDVANAIFYRTDALMLSGETAYGKYPVEAVRTMAKIAEEAEKTKLKDNDIKIPQHDDNDITSFLAKQAVDSMDLLNTRAIITDSYTGKTARHLAAYRGSCPILAICYKEQLIRQLALSYGVTPIYQEEKEDTRHYFFAALKMLIENGYLKFQDKVAYLSGSQSMGGGTTFLEINSIDNIFSNQKDYLLPNF
ncbi:MAG: pyruvate kinase [Prevotellaceae bacterium]|nr:pyruvate kinase [Prevotellaceae bacterium]